MELSVLPVKTRIAALKRHDQADLVYLADQLGIDPPTHEALGESFTTGSSLLDPTRPESGSTNSTYRLPINVKPAMLEPTES